MSADSRAGRAAGTVAAGILLSRLSGLLRMWVFARYFGSGAASDAYTVALKIPNAVRNLFGEGTLSAAFVPLYSALLARDDPRAARALANAMLGVLLVAVSALTLIGIAMAPWLTAVLATGFEESTRALTTRMIRVLFPMTGFMVLSGWCLGVQNSHRRFFMSYASAAVWSLAQVVLLIGWGARAESTAQLAWWLAWATLAGAVLQVAIQAPQVWSLVRPVRPTLDLNAEGLRNTLRNVLPVVTALGVVQLSAFVDVQIASRLPAGSITNLQYANQLMLLPVALFGVSVAASSLPEFSREHAGLATDALRERLQNGWMRILFYIVPSAFVFIAFGDLCVGMLYRSGRFGAAEQQLVHGVLAAYAVALLSYASVRLLVSAYYALQDYRTPLRASVVSVLVSAAAAAAFALPWRTEPWAVAGLALGSALGSYVNLTWLWRGLRARLGPLGTADMRRSAWRIVLASVLALMAAWGVRALVASRVGAETPWFLGPPVLLTFAAVYLAGAWWMGSGEAARWVRRPRRGPTPS